MIRRMWILFITELKVWKADPITALGGVIPCAFILIAFALLFGGRLSFPIAVINDDKGIYGDVLLNTFQETISPLDNEPYYAVQDMTPEQAWKSYRSYQIEGIWMIPEDFSRRIATGDNPQIDMYFMNYNDDRAKNHRIYAAEVLWAFYKKIDLPEPPLEKLEDYPLPIMVDWVSVISIGIYLLSVTLGAIFNMFILTYKAQTGKITLEIGLSPRSLSWVLIPKLVLSLLFGLGTGMIFLIIIWFWLGFWPGHGIWWVLLLSGLVAVFWSQVALAFGLVARNYFAGAVGSVLGALTIFFIGGGLSMVRAHQDAVMWIAWLFPNTYAVDPLRDLILFQIFPTDFGSVMVKLVGFALFGLAMGSLFAVRKLRSIT